MMSHVCVDLTIAPSGKFILNGFVAICTLLIFKPSITNREVAPMSATACVLANDIVLLSVAPYAMLSFFLGLVGRHYSFVVSNYATSFDGVQSLININCLLKTNNSIYLPRPTLSEAWVLRLVHRFSARIVPRCNELLGITSVVPLLISREGNLCRA